MGAKLRERGSWRGTESRTSAAWAMAVALIGIMGFAVAGAFLGATAATSAATKTAAPAHTTQTIAQKIPQSMAAKLHHVHSNVVSTTSTNWGGYADTVASGGAILEVLGEWNVPTISCGVYPAIQDNWVGIDGFGSGTVEQGGTYGYCTSTGAGPFYWTWWEFYPYNGIQSFSSSVSAGDLIEAYVLYNPNICINANCGIYDIVVNDLSNYAASLSVVGNPSTCIGTACENGPDLSAECISESLAGQGYYLPDYVTTTFITCDAEISGHFSGIGHPPAGVTVTKINTLGYASGLLQQKCSGLTAYDYPKDHFTITWKRYN
jgi:Peptidase A4 family